MKRPLRIAAVSFANARPLIAGLAGDEGIDLVLAPPARCADLLEAGRVDVGLVPAITLFQGPPALERVSRGVIAAAETARTVLVVSDRPIAAARTVRLSAHSRTSNALARILFHLAGRRMSFVAPDATADAAIMIGDPAFAAARRFPHRLDLASAWRALTGLPFVFAVFCARPGAAPDAIEPILDRARAHGLARLEAIAADAALELGVEPDVALRYFTEDLHYEATAADEQGLALFGRFFGLQRVREETCDRPARAS